ncbi:MAG: hypothetical protein QNJ54_03665 [Prochloraceae cyanobacterium]|nr:hypothetical protein [Prochloraceae cyanobacterium]
MVKRRIDWQKIALASNCIGFLTVGFWHYSCLQKHREFDEQRAKIEKEYQLEAKSYEQLETERIEKEKKLQQKQKQLKDLVKKSSVKYR